MLTLILILGLTLFGVPAFVLAPRRCLVGSITQLLAVGTLLGIVYANDQIGEGLGVEPPQDFVVQYGEGTSIGEAWSHTP